MKKEEEPRTVMSQITIPLIIALLAIFWFAIAALSRKTNPGTSRLAVIGGLLAVAICIALVLILTLKVTISAEVAVPLFVATIIEFGFLIALTSRTLGGRVSQRGFMVGVLAIIAAILIGVVLMFQPATPLVFGLGFDFVLIALLAFNVWSHVTPRAQKG
jgi:hypothetical protein